MKNIFILLATFLVINASAQHDHQKAAAMADTTKKSIPREVHTEIGEAHIMIFYSAPAVRGRVIWGGLVPYGEVWVTGAHKATTWEFTNNIEIDKTVIPAGKYAIFTIPGKEKWTFIVNKKWDQHLADEYNAKEDVVRLDVTPQVTTSNQERLLYSIDEGANNNGVLTIRWEKMKISIPFLVK
jgi:hypothetical protein